MPGADKSAQRLHHTGRQWQGAGLEELRVANGDLATGEVDVAQVQVHDLAQPQSGAVREHEHRVQGERPQCGPRRGPVQRGVEQKSNFGRREQVRLPPLDSSPQTRIRAGHRHVRVEATPRPGKVIPEQLALVCVRGGRVLARPLTQQLRWRTARKVWSTLQKAIEAQEPRCLRAVLTAQGTHQFGVAAQEVAQEAGERRQASNGFERLVRVSAEQCANDGRCPPQPVLDAQSSQGIDRDETIVDQKIEKPIEYT